MGVGKGEVEGLLGRERRGWGGVQAWSEGPRDSRGMCPGLPGAEAGEEGQGRIRFGEAPGAQDWEK